MLRFGELARTFATEGMWPFRKGVSRQAIDHYPVTAPLALRVDAIVSDEHRASEVLGIVANKVTRRAPNQVEALLPQYQSVRRKARPDDAGIKARDVGTHFPAFTLVATAGPSFTSQSRSAFPNRCQMSV